MTQAEARRSEILAAARAIVLEEGYQAASMRRIARRVNITPTALYLYFRNKEEMMARLMEEMFEILLDRFKQEPVAKETSVDRLRRVLKLYVRFVLNHPDHYRVSSLLHTSQFNLDTLCERPDGAPSAGEKCFFILHDSIAACLKEGSAHSRDATILTEIVWGMAYGVAAVLIGHNRDLETPEEVFIDRFLSTVLAGIAAHG